MQDYVDQIDINQYLPLIIDVGINVLLAALILIVGLYIANKASAIINKIGEKYDKLDNTLFRFLGSVAKYIILAFVAIAVLNRFGVQTASIVALLGAAGLAVGLALQGTLSNLAAGVMLLLFRPYKVGDFISAADRFGNVQEIDLFTTILRTFDNQHIIVPNSQIWGAQIVNHSFHDIRGVDMHFGVAYKENTDEVRKVIDAVLAAHPHILKDPAPFVEVETLNDSSVDFLVRPFCHGEHYFDILYSIPEQIKKALDEAGIEIPFPHRKLIIEKE
ncbi:mechanosensitive ion channel [Shewanella sp. 1_MG-2023]|uniref:Small-conductance mechanosensitive channel n=1 Tax=Shewanella electrodiphila TaxID=934143 RepID=A0ABT0KNE7_9GAMM|nr:MULTISPECIES: mechanosensitive ion channel domain-containing protein [Shewanella]MCC4832470.1 mechanosensitive ion channel [Shewanella sp. 10N.7]MCL1045375.1 mechanosensitive ion channel [Shewanella electrodiphila]MDO6611328.1 mechanosensitive ion channel [Shewanella sp. 7_MG-2023]MDO6771183.1 mechanosensitive ion channel [Shewanella sp. 2_MG-2023]MDO6795864.1 mechanosensitive ion channel [Shewanella sp. 1_MG-2023]